MTNLVQLFPTAISLKALRKPTKAEVEDINSMERRGNQGNEISVERHVLERDGLSDLKDLILNEIQEFFSLVWSPREGCSIKLQQSWCNYSDSHDWHHKHSHQNSAISGVYYVQAEHPDDHIMFHTPLEPYHRISVAPQQMNPVNAPSQRVTAKTGFLVLFPSYLEHSVLPVGERNTTRISLSFNAFYSGDIGDPQTMTELHI